MVNKNVVNGDTTTLWDASSISDSAKIQWKALTYWYNVIPSDVLTTTIWPKRSVATPSEATTVLNFSFDPTHRGIYNTTPDLINDGADPRLVWGGIMRSIYGSPAPTDLTSQNVTDLEVWVKIITANNTPIPPTAKMFFDLGLISEDVIPNGKLDTEDGILPDHNTPTGILYPGEDIGIDDLSDAQEQQVFAADVTAYGTKYPDMVNDPSGDDWAYTTGSSDYTHINGLEGNGLSEFGRTPDTEDLNKNNALDAQNSYFEYEVNLDTTTNNPQRVGAGTDGWTEIRVPLQHYARAVGSPSLQNVQTARIWFSGFSSPVTFRFAQIDLVGSRWIRLPQDTTGTVDSNFSVSFVNYEDNGGYPDYYTSPPGVVRPRNPFITTAVVYENEQSLKLTVKDLPKGQTRQAVQYQSGLNIFNYKTLGVFVHGDGTLFAPGDTLSKDDKADFILRIGTDSLNFYEYRERIHQGWDDIRINFSDITSVKASRTTAQDSILVRVPAGGSYPYGATFAIRGQPTLTKVTYFSLGIVNASSFSISDSIWVDELRVIGSNNNNDWAAIINAGLTIGDLGQMQFSAAQNNPDFHSMDTRFGDKIRHRTWSFSAQTGLEHFLKFYPGLSVPFVYSHTESLDDPEYIPQSDISVPALVAQTRNSLLAQNYTPAQADALANNIQISAQTLVVRDAYTISGVKIPIPTKFWLLDDTWNKLTYSFDYSKMDMRSPYIEHQETWGWTASIRYAVQLKPFLFVKPFWWSGKTWFVKDYKEYQINFMPSSFSAGISIARSETTEKDRGLDSTNPVIRAFTATRSATFAWPFSENGILNPTINYNLSIASTLLPEELIDSNTERPFSEVLKSMFFNNGLFNFGPENSVSQSVQLTMKPKVPKIFSLDRFSDLQSSYDVTYGWANTLTQGDLGKSATWTSKLQIGMNIKLKALTESWFGPENGGAKTAKDTGSSEEFSPGRLFDYAIREPIFDYDAINVTFSQNNSSMNQGLQGGTGISNFWRPSQDLAAGPNRLYQLGLISSPDGNLSVQAKSGFPFVQFVTEPGRRAIDATLTDNFQQTNSLELRTSRELWKGATLTLNWKSQWNFNNNQTIVTDSLGIPSVQSSIASLNISRSYLSLPPFLFLSVFNNTVSNVVSHYQKDRATIESTPGLDSTTKNARLTEALADDFENGFEALSFFPKAIQRILPRVNWTFRWEGLEKLPFFEPFAQRVSIEHTYTGLYTRNLQSNPDGSYSTQGQTISIGFQPLLAINMTFKEKIVGGNLSAQARYNTTTAWSSQGAAA
ncbi:MAG TPA: cell surface protein SprA, partial [Candidatus Kapabacteria bacterium]|nr:cell surface protein SprA [Candidatus Kapabacteria bacterium]